MCIAFESAFSISPVSWHSMRMTGSHQSPFFANLSCYERHKTRAVIDWGIEALP